MCKISPASIAADGQAVAKAVASISVAVEATNPNLSTDLNTASAALVAATANWQTGTPVADINTAAAAIEAILASIPQTALYATFVAIAVAALDILIGNLGTQSTQTANVVGNALALQAHVETLPENPYRGLVTIRPSVFGIKHAVVSKWNKQVEAQPELNFVKL